MGNERKTNDYPIRPVADLRPFASVLHHIEQGAPEKVDPVDVAIDLRKHGASALPAELVDWLRDHLEGNIETRGRKGETSMEKRVAGLHAAHWYDTIRKAQKGDPDALPEAVNIWQSWASETEDSYSPSEASWMVVSCMIDGQPGHHKTLRNLAGAARSSIWKPARK